MTGSLASSRGEFAVELSVFSGPFRLLADLILDQRVDVCDVPLAGVTDGFLRQGLERLDGWDLEEVTWFLAVCALMLELKVGRLLPRPGPGAEEDLLGGTSPDLLYARTLELAAFHRMADMFAERMEAASLMVPRPPGLPEGFAHLYPDFMDRVTADDLRRVAALILAPTPEVDLTHVTPIRASLALALDSVREQLKRSGEARFRDLIEGCEDRIDVVVRFLALLELYREGRVELLQASMFGDIEVRWHGEKIGE
jgi:segregation and condensation protein A